MAALVHVLMRTSAGARGIYGARQAVLTRETEGLDFELSDLQDCSVHLRGRMGALRMRGLRRCLVYAGPVTGAAFLEGQPSHRRCMGVMFMPPGCYQTPA